MLPGGQMVLAPVALAVKLFSNMSAIADLIQNALELPPTDRSYLAKKLLESLDEPSPPSAEQVATLERRSREIRDGAATPLSLTELQREVESRLG